jgi:type II secretory pathway component GspD/PulD (secretin)
MSRLTHRTLLSLTLALLLAVPLWAVPKPEEQAKSESAAEKCRKALEQPQSVNFEGLTLTAAIDSLRDQTKLNFILDRATIALMEISPDDTPVTLKVANVKLRTILKSLLSQYKLAYVVEQEIILITSEQVAIDRQVHQRVSVDFDKLPLDKALKQLGKETGTNLVLDPRQAAKVKDEITLKLDDVPLETTVRLMAEMAGLRSVRQSNVLFVTTKEVAAELRKEEEAATQQSNTNASAILERLINAGVLPGR